mgnify:FL=1
MTNLSQPNNQDTLPNATPNATHSYDAADMADQLKVMPTLEAHLTTILNEINALRDFPQVTLFKQLLDTLRNRADDAQSANEQMALFIRLLRGNRVWAEGFCVFMLTLINRYRQVSLYTDLGILSDAGFTSQFFDLVGEKLLPSVPDDRDLIALFNAFFATPKTRYWVRLINERRWIELILILKVPAGKEALVQALEANVLKAITILTARINGIGLNADLIKAFPNPIDNQDTFIALNREVAEFVSQYQLSMQPGDEQAMPQPEVDSSQILVLTDQARTMMQNIRRRIHRTGITVRTTNMLVRLEQSLQRLELLVSLLSDNNHIKKKTIIELINTLYEDSYHRSSFRYLFGINTALLSRRVTETASKVGEHYISTDKAGYRRMYKKAALGGLLIGFMATLKILGKSLPLAPFGVAFLNSMIYGLGFVAIHIIGGTVATKQPAMTAAAIASTISEVKGRKAAQFTKLTELVVDIMRTQFIAIMGNISIAMPIALLISSMWLYGLGRPLTSEASAEHLLHDLNPFTSLAIFHAAIAGVYLYISGLIAGYYDNLAVHNKIGERIRNHPTLKRMMTPVTLLRFSDFIERNLGAIMSNFLFGCFLGSTATIGYIFGLPLDIRHIAFASANFIHGIFNIYANTGKFPEIGIILVSLFGVMVIGMINLLVSFSLALMTALRARNVKVFEWKFLFELVASHLMTQPSDFFIPRKQPMNYALIDSDGNIIYDDKPIANDGKNNKGHKTALTSQPEEHPHATTPHIDNISHTEKLTDEEVAEKKQAIKEKVVQKAVDNITPNDTASKLPK